MLTSSLTAAELMTSQIVTIEPEATLQEAMQLMHEHRVGSLPVVNRKGLCTGIVTGRDILTCELAQAEDHDEGAGEEGSYFNPDTETWESVSVCMAVDELPEKAVREVMSDQVIFVYPTTVVAEVAEVMVEEGLHHILVMDDEQRLHGVISSLDFVKLVMQVTQ
ncbi:MAG: CBS domain-containing protein [Planctomycetaceae bacterium]|nr:CBS domain-containing protein [Planctomycetaceae bacterium]